MSISDLGYLDPWQDVQYIADLYQEDSCEKELPADGFLNGEGTYRSSKGSFYQGEFLDGQFHGQGTLTSFDGMVYRGQFSHGKFHGKGTLIEASGVSREGFFHRGVRIDSSQSELGDELFVDLLFGGEKGSCSGYPLGIIADYLSCHPNVRYQVFARPLLESLKVCSVDSNVASKRIYEALQEGRSYLIPYGSLEHAMGLRLVPSNDRKNIYCEIYNSGAGLNAHHIKHPFDEKFRTLFKVKILFSELTRSRIEVLLNCSNFNSFNESYHQILEMKGACVVQFDDNLIWQAAQKGGNCTLEWIFAYLKHQMPEELYKSFKRELFLACLESAGQATEHLPSDKRVPTHLVSRIRNKLLKLEITQ